MDKLSAGTVAIHRWRSALVASAIFLVSLLATACVSQQVFEGVPHIEDEFAFLFQAKTLAAGRIWVDTPANLEFFNLPFLIDHDGKWFGKYPPGHPLVLALGVLVGHPWLIDPLASSLALVVIYLLGRRLYGERTAVIAVGLGVSSPFFLLQSGTYLSHPTTLLFVSVFLYSLLRMNEGSRAFAVVAGFSIGMAFLSRQLTAVGVAVPFVIHGLYQVAHDPRRHGMNYLLVVALFVPFVAALLAYNAALTGSPFTSTYELYWPYDRIGFGPGVGPGDQHTLDIGLLNTRVNLGSLSTHLFGWPWHLDLVFIAVSLLALLLSTGRLAVEPALPGLPGTTSAQRRAVLWDGLLLAAAASLVGVHVLYWTSGLMYGPRYYYEAMPSFLLLSARGINHVAGLGSVHRWARSLWAFIVGSRSLLVAAKPASTRIGLADRIVPAAVGVVVLALVVHSLTVYLPTQFRQCRGWYGITGQASRLASELKVEHAIVLVPPGKSWTDYAPLIELNNPTLDSDTIFAIDHGPEHNRVLVDQFPGRTLYYWNDMASGLSPATAE